MLDKDDRVHDHNQAVCDLLSNRALKRYVRESKDGKRLLLDRERLRNEKRLAGVRLLRTTLVDRPPLEVLAAYQALLGLEDNFRTLKGPLWLRPMYHRRAHRIRAHVMICVLALLCLREIEVRTGLRWIEVAKLFGPVRATLVEDNDLRFWQRAEWGDDADGVLELLGIAPARAPGACIVSTSSARRTTMRRCSRGPAPAGRSPSLGETGPRASRTGAPGTGPLRAWRFGRRCGTVRRPAQDHAIGPR